MIDIFGKRYKSISSIFVDTIEDEHFVYPYPLSVKGTLENAEKGVANELEFRFASYFDSPLVLDSSFDLCFYCLTPYYQIEVIAVQGVFKKEDILDTYGYKGVFSFQDGSVSMNILETDIYDKFKLFEDLQQDER